ncbi:hypothetical protein BK139_21715, partial [Paenibacillus sp. FSL R5-0490]
KNAFLQEPSYACRPWAVASTFRAILPKRQITPFCEARLVLEARRMRVMQTLPQDVAILVCVPSGQGACAFLFRKKW